MGEKQRENERQSGVTGLVVALVGVVALNHVSDGKVFEVAGETASVAGVLAGRLGIDMPNVSAPEFDAGPGVPARLKNVTVNSNMDQRDAEKLLDCDIQDGSEVSSSERKCIQAFARAAGLNSYPSWNNNDAGCLNQLWTGESGWNKRADNPTSSAYGIPQALTQLHDLPRGYNDDAVVQVQWGLKYIEGRYGDPCGALNEWESRSPHWY